jgi:hypothetical protein
MTKGGVVLSQHWLLMEGTAGPSTTLRSGRDDKVEGTRSPQQSLPRDGQSRRLSVTFILHLWIRPIRSHLASLQICCQESMKKMLTGLAAHGEPAGPVGSGMQAPLY